MGRKSKLEDKRPSLLRHSFRHRKRRRFRYTRFLETGGVKIDILEKVGFAVEVLGVSHIFNVEEFTVPVQDLSDIKRLKRFKRVSQATRKVGIRWKWCGNRWRRFQHPPEVGVCTVEVDGDASTPYLTTYARLDF